MSLQLELDAPQGRAPPPGGGGSTQGNASNTPPSCDFHTGNPIPPSCFFRTAGYGCKVFVQAAFRTHQPGCRLRQAGGRGDLQLVSPIRTSELAATQGGRPAPMRKGTWRIHRDDLEAWFTDELCGPLTANVEIHAAGVLDRLEPGIHVPITKFGTAGHWVNYDMHATDKVHGV